MTDKISKAIELLEQAKLLIIEVENEICSNSEVFVLPITSLDLQTNKSHQTRFENVCIAFNINTIGDLIKYGRVRFSKLRNVGPAIVQEAKAALKHQYNIIW